MIRNIICIISLNIMNIVYIQYIYICSTTQAVDNVVQYQVAGDALGWRPAKDCQQTFYILSVPRRTKSLNYMLIFLDDHLHLCGSGINKYLSNS